MTTKDFSSLSHFKRLFDNIMVNDIFNIKEIYPTADGGDEWFLDDDPENDGRIDSDPENIVAVGDYFTVDNTSEFLLSVSGSGGFPTADCNIDYSDLAARGYRYQSGDWKNIEQTVFLYIQDVDDLSGGYMAIRGRDFTRSLVDDEDTDCCDRVRYAVRIYHASSGSNAGRIEFSKVIAGVADATTAVKQTVVPNFYRRWVGHKFIIYNLVGTNQVRLEHWICPSDSATDKGNNWTLANSFTDTGSNFGSGGDACGGTDEQAITWGNINTSIHFTGDELRFKNWSVREIDYQGSFGGGGGSGGGGDPQTGNCGSTDTLGIKWMVGSGEQTVIEQSRDDSNDYRWSQNYQNILTGYEATVIGTFDGVASDGHMALKHWGPNHSGDCGYSEGGDCCCWYDTGIRANGDVQTEIERPHPSNDSWSCPECTMSNIGKGMDGNSIGLKWLVYPLTEGGNVDNGGMKLKMWVDTDPLNAQNRPNNNWVLVYDITDNPSRDILADYDAPDEQEIELRVSDTDTADFYGGGVHVRRLRRPEDLVPCSGGGGGGGGGGGTEPPVCPTGYHWDATRQLCVSDGGGGTNPDPPIPETMYNDLTIIYNILSDSDGCICSPAPYTPPPPPPPPPTCPPGQHWDPVQLACVDDSVPPPPPPPPGDALYNIPYTGGTEVQIGMDSGNSSRYLQYGIWIRGSQSQIMGKVVKRGEIALKKVGAPTGLATVTIRNGDTDAIETTLGTIDCDEVGSTPQYYPAENLNATYTVQDDDRLMIEFDGGDEDNYLVGYRQSSIEGNDTKVTKRSNTHSEGDYSSDDKEFASKWFA